MLIYISFYKITEKNEDEHERYIGFNEESPRIEKYYSNLDINLIVTVKEDEILRQSNNFTLIAQDSEGHQKCDSLLKQFLNYEDNELLKAC